MSIPSEKIYMCTGVPLTNDYKHTLYFNSSAEQYEYMSGKVATTFSSYTFVRENRSLKVAASFNVASKWNYMFYMKNGSTMVYYAFITKVEYVNDTTTAIFFEIDVMQTYLNRYTLKECFVEREHSETDGLGDNIVDEGLELGEFVNLHQVNVAIQDLCLLVMSSVNPNNGNNHLYSANYGGVWSGLRLFAADHSVSAAAIGEKLKELDTDGKSEGIFTMWMYPKNLVVLADGDSWTDTSLDKTFKFVAGVKTFEQTLGTATAFTKMNPKNKKLFTYPFNYLYVSNNSGGAATYRYEFFEDPTNFKMRVVGGLSPDAAIKMFPINYKGTILNYEEGLQLAGYPTCAWSQDAYKLWLAQNQGQQLVTVGGAALSVIGGIASIAAKGDAAIGVGNIVSGVSTVASMLAQRHDASVQPPQSKGTMSSNVNITAEFQTFTIQYRAVDETHRAIIDEYFTRFGYATRRVKVPNTHVRERFTFTKTVDCQAVGNIGADVLRKIESIFDNGVTFWSDPETVGNYTTDNLCLK